MSVSTSCNAQQNQVAANAIDMAAEWLIPAAQSAVDSVVETVNTAAANAINGCAQEHCAWAAPAVNTCTTVTSSVTRVSARVLTASCLRATAGALNECVSSENTSGS